MSLLGLAVSMAAVPVVRAQADPEPPFDRVEDFVEQSLDTLRIPGAALAVLRDGEVVYMNAWGETGGVRRPVTTATPFLVGSNSKALTAYALMQLVDAGAINLDAPVRQYLPEFELAAPDAANAIAVRHLICHRSGISAGSGARIADLGENDPRALQRSVRRLRLETPTAKPGEVYQYSAANYALIGAIIERVAGVSFSGYMEKSVFHPLGMRHAAADAEAAKANGWQPGYRSWFGVPITGDIPYDGSGAPYGYMAASVEDMARFLIALQKPGTALSAEFTERYLQPLAPGGSLGKYGYGWRITKLESSVTKIWHAGATADFRSEAFLLKEPGWGVVLLTNRNSGLELAALTPVALGIQAILLGGEPPAVEPIRSSVRRYAVVVNLLLFAVLCGFLWNRRHARKGTWRRRLQCLIAGLCLFGGLGLMPAVLHVLNFPARSLLLFAPDLSLLVGMASALLTGMGVVGLLPAKRKKPGAAPVSGLVTTIESSRWRGMTHTSG